MCLHQLLAADIRGDVGVRLSQVAAWQQTNKQRETTSTGSGAVSGLDAVAATVAANTAWSSLEATGAASLKVWSWHAGHAHHILH